MGLEKHPVLVSVLVSKKLSGLGLGLGLEACGLDYNTGKHTVAVANRSLSFRGFDLSMVLLISLVVGLALWFSNAVPRGPKVLPVQSRDYASLQFRAEFRHISKLN